MDLGGRKRAQGVGAMTELRLKCPKCQSVFSTLSAPVECIACGTLITITVARVRRGSAGSVRKTDPDTAHDAAETAPVNRLEEMFLRALRGGRTLTTTEIANVYEMDRDSFSPRSRPLEEKHLIEQNGTRVCLNSAGKPKQMIACRLTLRGEAYMRTGHLPKSPSQGALL